MKQKIIAIICVICLALSGCSVTVTTNDNGNNSNSSSSASTEQTEKPTISTTTTTDGGTTTSSGEAYVTETLDSELPVMLDEEVSIPAWEGEPYIIVNDNQPTFSEAEKTCVTAFENYSELDELGRCGVASANICTELMPTEKRGDISRIHPTGWQSGMNWERCHLIGYQLAGENANKLNLITGTRYFNVTGMLPFENAVADYAESGGHVLYRVTPIYNGDDLIASGAEMEGWSVEDNGESVCFNVYVFNVTPNAEIDYCTGTVTTGKDEQNAEVSTVIPDLDDAEETIYYISSSGKIHSRSDCSGMKKYTEMTLEEAESHHYQLCPKCNDTEEEHHEEENHH